MHPSDLLSVHLETMASSKVACWRPARVLDKKLDWVWTPIERGLQHCRWLMQDEEEEPEMDGHANQGNYSKKRAQDSSR